MRKSRRRRADRLADIYLTMVRMIDDVRANNSEDAYAVIAFLKVKLEEDPEDVLLRNALKDEYFRVGDMKAEEELLREDIRKDPEHPLNWTALAQFLARNTAKLAEAWQAARRAVLLARKQGRGVIQTYGVLARISRTREDYDTLSACLEDLMDYQVLPDALERRYERSFLWGLPQGAIDPDLRARYGTFMRRSGHLRDYRPHRAIALFRPVAMLAAEGKTGELSEALLARAEDALRVVRDLKGAPESILSSDNVEGAILALSDVINQQLTIVKDIICGIEDDRISLGMDEAERLAFERFKAVKGRYFRRHGRDELKRYIASMRAGEFDDW
jgi:hypothetical protein